MRFFNTEGPVDCARHYCLPPLKRLDLDEVLLLIEQQKSFNTFNGARDWRSRWC